jgi:hypothetical protein
MVPTGSDVPAHSEMFKTLNLFSLDTKKGLVYFVTEGVSTFEPDDDLQSKQKYFYEEHTCPTNFIRCELISFRGDMDPHGVFDHVRTIWMTPDYDKENGESYFREHFPELQNQVSVPAVTEQ